LCGRVAMNPIEESAWRGFLLWCGLPLLIAVIGIIATIHVNRKEPPK
jgi:hypothetical protein